MTVVSGTLTRVIVAMRKTTNRIGFVTPDDGGEDVFVHVKDNPNLAGLEEGDRVEVDRFLNLLGRFRGTNLSLVVDLTEHGGGQGGGGGGQGGGGFEEPQDSRAATEGPGRCVALNARG